MVEGATAGATARLLTGELTYDHFLAEFSQATAVDVPAMGAALARLVGDPALRRRMGEAGRRRACEHFAWSHVIHLYEDLWREQERERSARAGSEYRRLADATARPPIPTSSEASPAIRPAGSTVPTCRRGARATDGLELLLALPLAHHAAGRRVTDAGLLPRVASCNSRPRPFLILPPRA